MVTRLSCALAIGGLDPGGGAGVVADVRAFHAAGAFGCAAVAVVTVQSTAALRDVHVLPARQVVDQAAEVLRHQRVRAIKIGALGSRENVRAIARLLESYGDVPMVLDTPIWPSRGGLRLLSADAIAPMRTLLMPMAALVTLNLDEVRVMLGQRVKNESEAREAARALVRAGARAALVKGGHMAGEDAVDVLALGDRVIELRVPRLPIPATHGTGCTLAALIAGRLAREKAGGIDSRALLAAVRWAKRVHHTALANVADVGRGMRVVTF